jgi:uncharacterized protein
MKKILDNCTGFEWDMGNLTKNWERHQVSMGECEQVFFNEPMMVFDDIHHSHDEMRWYLLGKTDSGRLLFVVFTIRKNLIRIISARDMNKNERIIYYGKS